VSWLSGVIKGTNHLLDGEQKLLVVLEYLVDEIVELDFRLHTELQLDVAADVRGRECQSQ
jgi:hypothetical protein